MKQNYYLRAFNKLEAKNASSKQLELLKSFVDVIIEAEDGEITLKHNGKFIIRCKEYKIGNLFHYENWNDAINLSEYQIFGQFHLLIAVNPGYMLEYKVLTPSKS